MVKDDELISRTHLPVMTSKRLPSQARFCSGQPGGWWDLTAQCVSHRLSLCCLLWSQPMKGLVLTVNTNTLLFISAPSCQSWRKTLNTGFSLKQPSDRKDVEKLTTYWRIRNMEQIVDKMLGGRVCDSWFYIFFFYVLLSNCLFWFHSESFVFAKHEHWLISDCLEINFVVYHWQILSYFSW